MSTHPSHPDSSPAGPHATADPLATKRPAPARERVRWPLDLGLPDPSTFPRSAFLHFAGQALAEGDTSLLYGGPGRAGIARGHAGLRAVLADRYGGAGGADGVMLTSGAAHAVELLWRATLSTGDTFAVEAPTWGASIRIGRALGAEPLAVPMDQDGMRIDILERGLADLEARGGRLKLVYVIADFNTPTGWSLSLPRRRRLLQLAEEHDFLVVEDRVYAELRYDGPALPAISALHDGDRVVTVGSFSKTLAPALRCGWLSAKPDLVCAIAATREDLGSSRLTAEILEPFLRTGGYDRHLSDVTRLYRGKRDTVVSALRTHCGDAVRFDIPHGGMFFWIELADDIDGRQVMEETARAGILCRPGEAFFGDDGDHQQWFRMAFTKVAEPELARGVQVLGEAIGRSGKRSGSRL
ncbi:PLP-dependent aminotransferase family protein [Nonomuraea sp. NPDC051941]|uniref:PLP-dependent aminotransferase family protein n=1 Tax=Nonomuraea sp. NPDC051941 TaxID=3364373 RepID=UPI0037CC998E